MQRRKLIAGGVSSLAASSGLVPAQSQDDPLEDIVVQDADVLFFEDGFVYRDNAQELAMPWIESPQRMGERSEPLILLPNSLPTSSRQSLAFNLYLPEDHDLTLFEPGQERAMVVRPSPSLEKAASGNTSDGRIKKKYDVQLARFEAHGIIANDLKPTCVGAPVAGIWLKVDLLGWLLGSVNRWKTYAEGSLGEIKGQPGQYQFHWTKPNICSTGTSSYDAIYNGLVKMLRDLVEEIAGAIGKFLDKLLSLSSSIAKFIATAIVKWIGTGSNSGSGTSAQFSLSASPASVRVARGGSATYGVTVRAEGGFKGTVALTASGSSKSTVSFSPSRIDGSGQSRLTVRTSRTSPTGTHQLSIIATSGSVRKSTAVTLVIT